MPAHTFVFSLTLPGAAGFDTMLADLSGAVLRYVEMPPAAAAQLAADVKAAIAKAGAHGDITVRFDAHDGTLNVAVSNSGREIARVARPIPQ